jgi:hypothetical protein
MKTVSRFVKFFNCLDVLGWLFMLFYGFVMICMVVFDRISWNSAYLLFVAVFFWLCAVSNRKK